MLSRNGCFFGTLGTKKAPFLGAFLFFIFQYVELLGDD